jgi:hypothetical protein
MDDLRYEPLPPTVVDQRTTREGHYILYFVPADPPPIVSRAMPAFSSYVGRANVPSSQPAEFEA